MVSLKYNKRLIQDFEARVINFDDNKKSFLNDSLDNVINNAKILTSHLEELGLKNNNTWGFKDSRAMYAKKNKKRELNQKLISSYKLLNNSIEIKWPLPPGKISNRDLGFKLLTKTLKGKTR